MRSVAVCLFCFIAPLTAFAGDISADHQGTWTESGQCPQPKRIVVSGKTVTLVQPGMTRVLTDGDEAVFNGETLINASLPAKKEQDPVLAFSAKIVERDGELTLTTTGGDDQNGFAGAFRKCKASDARTAAIKQKNAKKTANARRAPGPYAYDRYRPGYGYYYVPGPRLGGLY